jgi:hypothetical protein
MKATCPKCVKTIPAADIDLATGWAKCAGCDEVFPLGELVPGYVSNRDSLAAAPMPPERPFDAWTVVERSGETLFVHTPPTGMRAGTWALMGFATFWLGFVGFWTAGALGVFFGNNNGIRWENALFAAFSTPFWLVGFGMAGGVLWMARGRRIVHLDASQLTTELRCLFWRRRKIIDRAAVQCAREGVMTIKSNNSNGNNSYFPYSAEIIYENGSFKIPCNSEAERAWIIGEINDFLQNTPYRPSPYADGQFDNLLRKKTNL